MKDWRKAIVPVGTSIRASIATIDAGALQIALVVGADERLVGTVTDGDVRRGILTGVPLEEPVERIMNASPKVVSVEDGRPEALRLMRERKIHQIPVVDAEGRVLRLETLDEVLSPEPIETWVVLMVGGLGSRLGPITRETPKPMLDVGGKPLLETIVEEFVRQGFRRIVLSVRFKSEVIERHFGDGENWGAEISYLTEDQRLGTAGALSLLRGSPPTTPFIVMNGDVLTDVNFSHLLEFHQRNGAEATMCVREYSFQVPYGVIEIEDQRLAGVSEKPQHHFFVNAGIYVLSPEALDLIPADRSFDMTQLFEEMVARGSKPAVFPIREYWLDIGQSPDLDRARGDISKLFS